MRIIKKLSGMIDDEIGGAIEYAKNAVLYKDSDKKLGEMFSEMADEELKHAERLHEAVVAKISEAKESGKTVPDGMMEVYEDMHEDQIERVGEAKRYLEQYKG